MASFLSVEAVTLRRLCSATASLAYNMVIAVARNKTSASLGRSLHSSVVVVFSNQSSGRI